MTKKHFKAIAEALSKAMPDNNSADALATWTQCVVAITDVCASTNPHFDRERFLDACGVVRAFESSKTAQRGLK